MMKKVLRFSAKEENEKLYHSRRSEEENFLNSL